MESTTVDLCRLCAKEKFPDEIIGQMNNESLDIESKLAACCRWNTFNEIVMSDQFPQSVCISCFQILQQCWDFAEQVRCAQFDLLSKFVCKVEADVDDDENPVISLDTLVESNSFAVHLENKFEINQFELVEPHLGPETTTFDGPNSAMELDNACFYDEEPDVEITEQCMQVEELKVMPEQRKFDGRYFLKAISMNDRNEDGTVKMEAIERLGLDNWSSIQHTCHLCHKQWPEQYDWQDHIRKEHPGHPIRHLCNICKVHHYSKRSPLMKHILTKHRRYFNYCCKKCNTYYWDLERLRAHYSDCGRVQKKLPSQSLCDICGKGCQSESILRAHREIHLSDSRRVYECIMCKNRFLSRRGLEQHIVMKHVNDKPQFQCDTCGKEFTWKFRYVRHLKLHSNDFPFECSQCGKKFRFKDKLVAHNRTHTGEKPFMCPLCEYRCGNDGNMSKHIRQKHGVSKAEAIKMQRSLKLLVSI